MRALRRYLILYWNCCQGGFCTPG